MASTIIPTKPRALTAADYEAFAQKYLHSLPLEHFMESTGQSTQREITLESMALLKVRRPDVQVFSELLVQYTVPGQRLPGQVVPDNMVVISEKPVQATTCFNQALQSAKPFWVLEYVSKSNKRKDYEDNFKKYERDLKVPYYLTFHPDDQDLRLHHHNGKKYVAVKPNKHGRLPIPELDLEIGLLDGWVRFWYLGKLLPLPAEIQRELDETRESLAAAGKQTAELKISLVAEQEARRAAEAEIAQLRAALKQHTVEGANGQNSGT